MIKIFLFLSVSLSSTLSFADGNSVRGGGSGCLAEFVSSGYEVAVWLSKNGVALQPPVAAESFLTAFNPAMVRATEENLTYNGHAVDAYFDGSQIFVRCDRFSKNSPSTQKRVVAHEVFRAMGLEGDDYKMSRQMSFPEGPTSSPDADLGPSVAPVQNGDYMVTCVRATLDLGSMTANGLVSIADEQVKGHLSLSLIPPAILAETSKTRTMNMNVSGIARFNPVFKKQSSIFDFVNRLQLRLAVTNLPADDSGALSFMNLVNTETYNGGVLDESIVRWNGVDYTGHCDFLKL